MISGAKKYDHTEPLFKILDILKIQEIYVYSLQFIMYKFRHHRLPAIFTDFFKINKHIHDYDTRQANLLHVPLAKIRQSSISVRRNGVHSYNHFYGIINIDCSISCYKKLLKSYIL